MFASISCSAYETEYLVASGGLEIAIKLDPMRGVLHVTTLSTMPEANGPKSFYQSSKSSFSVVPATIKQRL